MVCCCVPNCFSNSTKPKVNVTFHSFPKHTELREHWRFAIYRQGKTVGSLWSPNENSRVCSLHFNESDYSISTSKRVLLPNVVPSIFPGQPKCIQDQLKLKRIPVPLSHFTPTVAIKKARTKWDDYKIALNEVIPGPAVEEVFHETTPGSALQEELNEAFPGTEVEVVVNEDISGATVTEVGVQVSSLPLLTQRLTKKLATLKRNYKTMRQSHGRLVQTVNRLKEKLKEAQQKKRENKPIEFVEKVKKIKEDSVNGELNALFLLEQIDNYGKQNVMYGETTLNICVLWYSEAPFGYRFIRSINCLKLPHEKTLQRYLGCETDNTSVVKRGLIYKSSKLHYAEEIFRSPVINTTAIKAKMEAFTTQEIEDPPQNHLFEHKGILNVYNKDIVNLSVGAPGPDLLKKCISIFSQATAHRMEKEAENAYLFQYGPTAGLWDYRVELAKFLTSRYGETVNRCDLVLTCGASHGLMLIMNTFLLSNAVIFVDEVTYMIALDAFKQFPDMLVVPVPMAEEGVDTQALERIASEQLSKCKKHLCDEKLFWAMYYTMPLFHNPTGITFSTNCCKSLVEVARKLDMLVVCDDVYNLLHYGNEEYPPRRLFAYDRGSEGFCGGHVVSNGSFSKIMGPGVRVGWLEVPPRLASVLRQSGILKSGGSVNQYVSGIFASILELGLEEQHLNFLVKTFKERMLRACSILSENLPPGCSFVKPQGGYFVWLKLPDKVDCVELVTWCQDNYKVTAIPGNRFSVTGSFKNYLRVSISFHEIDILEEAAKRLCSVIGDYIKNHS